MTDWIRNDAQQDDLYTAEDLAAEVLESTHPVAFDPIPMEDVPGFLLAAAHRVGFGWSEPPEVVYDVPDDHEFSAWVSRRDKVMHLHPKLTSSRVLLHELAHVCRNDNHGPTFAGLLVHLWETTYPGSGIELLDAFLDCGVEVSPHWLPADLSEWARLAGRLK